MEYLYNNQIGKMSLIDIYYFYDGPKLFSCKSQTEQIYIVIWTDFNESEDVWFYIPISNKRFLEIKKGEISIRNAITEVEDGWIWKLTNSKEENEPIVEKIPALKLTEEDLPDKDSYLDVKEVFKNWQKKFPQSVEIFTYDALRNYTKKVSERSQLLVVGW